MQVDEDLDLGAARLFGRVQRRLPVKALELLDDRGGVDEHAAVELEHGHELLAAQADDLAAIGGVDVDPLGRQALVAQRQRDPLDVGRERDPPDAHQSRPMTSSGLTGTRTSSRPVASRSAATIAAVETTVGGSPTPLTP